MYGRIRAVCCGRLFCEYNRIFRIPCCFLRREPGFSPMAVFLGVVPGNVIDVIVRLLLVLGDFCIPASRFATKSACPEATWCDLTQVDNVIALQPMRVADYKGNKFHRDFSTGVNSRRQLQRGRQLRRSQRIAS